jgi:hypothetical protein
MFDHLDDASPVRADGTIRRAVSDRSRALARRPHRLMAAATIVVVALVSAGVAVAATRGSGRRVSVVTDTPSSLPSVTAVTEPPTTAQPSTTTTAVIPTGPAEACAALTPAGAAGSTRTATVKLGSVTARLAGTVVDLTMGDTGLSNVTLTVLDGGRNVRSDAVAAPKDAPAVIPSRLSDADNADRPLCVARFEGSPQPVVLLGLYLGGMHCCTVLRAYPLSSAPMVELAIGNPDVTVSHRSGGAILVTADNDFAYAFTSYAGSGVPVKVLEVRGNAFVDTTRHYPDLVANDAAQWMSAFNTPPPPGTEGDIRGVVAAWAADECLLGHGSDAFATVDRLNAGGKLGGDTTWPAGSAYVTALHKFLADHHYC